MMIETINPATAEKIKGYPETTESEIRIILNEAHSAFLGWRKTSFSDRAKPMKKAAGILRDRKKEFARLMALEMGKPLIQGESEIEKCAWGCDFYGGEAEQFLAPELVETDASKSLVVFEPIGLVLAVMPWNFPFWQVFRAAVPAMMAGNGVVLKHASNVTGCALTIRELFEQAGFPKNLFSVVLMGPLHVAQLIEAPLIKAVTLTGGTPAGKAIAAKAGEMIKKTVLELGGSDPYLILEDADLEPAVEACVASRLMNTGQSCIAAKRFIVVKSLKKQFEDLFVEKMRSKRMADPLKEDAELGPLARHDLRNGLHDLVERSVSAGAKLLLGGKIPDSKGAFYPPTVLTNVKKGMPAYQEETFGPVASIVEVENEREAIHVANDTIFGLGAAIFTKDRTRGERIAQDIEAGSCFVNTYVKSDPRLPFGGIKQSGYGRELSSFGIREFVNIKTIYIK